MHQQTRCGRRRFFRLAASAALLLATGFATAQTWPTKPVRIIATGPAGSAIDLVVRLLADGLSARLGQGVVIENRPTANGAVGAEFVARSRADGYELLFATTSVLAIAPHLNKSVKWSPLKDFTPVVEVGTTPSVIAVAADTGKPGFAELASAARARPDQLTFGVINLTLSHFVALALKQDAGIDLRVIPFSGQPQMITALLNHDVDAISTGAASLVPFFESGRMRPLAVTGAARLETLAAPPIGATVPGFDMSSWYGLFGPAGLNPKVTQRLNESVNAVLKDPAFAERMRQMATVATGGTPQRLRQSLEADYARYGTLIRKTGLTLE